MTPRRQRMAATKLTPVNQQRFVEWQQAAHQQLLEAQSEARCGEITVKAHLKDGILLAVKLGVEWLLKF